MKSLLSKKDAKTLIEQFGVSVKEEDIQVGRFFLVDRTKKVSVSPHCVCGEGANGLGVCFVYYCGDKAIYVRAFSGKHERKPEVVLKENSELVRYDQPGHTFIADATEWEVREGQIMCVKTKFLMTKMPSQRRVCI